MRYLVCAAALMLAACGSESNSETEVASGSYTDPETGETADYSVTKSADGETGSISIKTKDGKMQFGGGAQHAKLPTGFTPYPGSTMTGGFTASGDDGKSGMASFEATGNAADVIDHFRNQAEAAGMKITTEITAGDTMMLGAEKEGGRPSGVQITATQDGDKVTGSVTYGTSG